MPLKLTNNASGTLATAISASDTGIVLTTGDGAEFPTLGTRDYFYATVVSSQGTQEIVKVTARVGDTVTVVRAQEGTLATGFAAGARFELRVTAQTTLDVSRYVEYVSPIDYGAVGNGVTDDLAAVKAALESGKIVDGGGRTYAISGTCTPTSFVGLQNANFIQIGNNSINNVNTLNIIGFNNFFIDNVSISMGTNVTTLFADDGNNGLYVAGSAYNNESRNFRISRVTVTGNGCGTGIHVRHAERFIVTECLVHNRVSGASPDPTNDSQNGIQINNCANFVLSNSNVYNLRTRLAGVDTVRWTRGFLFVEIRDSTITGCNATLTDQGFDFSGAYVSATNYIGNRRWTIGNCTANASNTYGFKFANVTRDGLVTGCIANNTGSIAFVFSPSAVALPAGLEKYNTQNIDVVGCKAVNALGTGSAGTNATGFRMMSNPVYIDYPRSIRLKSCSVIDTQDVPTTLTGFASDSVIPEYPTTGYNESVANTTNDCTISSNIPTGFDGQIGPNICVLTGGPGGATQSIPNNTYTEVNWIAAIADPTRLHSTTSNNNKIYIKTAGWYQIHAQIQFAANGSGVRNARIIKNGSVLDRTTASAVPFSGTAGFVSTSIVTYLQDGDNVAVAVLQTSGGALDVLNNESNFSITLVS